MLRYIKLNPDYLQVEEFCCSRVIFERTRIQLPHIGFLFDNEFIDQTFKRYKRPANSDEPRILPRVCGKCDGYGYYDWVTRLTEQSEDDILVYGEMLNTPQILRNENPISVIFVRKKEHFWYLFYVSEFIPSPITYRCEKCQGTGLHLDLDYLTAITPDDCEDIPIHEPKPKQPNLNREGGIYQWLKKSNSKLLNWMGSLRI